MAPGCVLAFETWAFRSLWKRRLPSPNPFSAEHRCAYETVNLPPRRTPQQLNRRTCFMSPERRNWGKVTPSTQSPVHKEEPGKKKTTHKKTVIYRAERSSAPLRTSRHSGSWKVLFSSGFQTSLSELHRCSPSGVKWLILWDDTGSCGDLRTLFSVCSMIKCARNILSHLLVYMHACQSVIYQSISYLFIIYHLLFIYHLFIHCEYIIYLPAY